MNKLLELRNKLKRKKPNFLKQDAHKKKRLKNNWRKPKGRHSKLRLNHGGHRKNPSVGYSSPKKVKGLNREGIKEVVIRNIGDLENIKEERVVLSKKIGIKKRLKILEELEKKGLIANINFDKLMKKIKEKREEKLKRRKIKEERKKDREKTKKPKEEKDEEEKKKEEEKTKKKILEKKTTGKG